jgi:hypothetical protein
MDFVLNILGSSGMVASVIAVIQHAGKHDTFSVNWFFGISGIILVISSISFILVSFTTLLKSLHNYILKLPQVKQFKVRDQILTEENNPLLAEEKTIDTLSIFKMGKVSAASKKNFIL